MILTKKETLNKIGSSSDILGCDWFWWYI